jgi:replicative DNA helicase
MTKNDELKPFGTYLDSWQQTVEQRWQGKQDDSILRTGWPYLDQEIMGLRNGELTIVAGRPGMGKTSFVLCLLRQVAFRLLAEDKFSDAVALFSLEMSRDQLYNNLVSQESSIPISDLFRDYSALPKVYEQKKAQLNATLDNLALLDRQFHIDTTSSLSTDDMRERLHNLSTSHKPRLIALDYLQLLATTKGVKRNDAIGENTRALKAIAKDFDCPVIVLSQLSRAVENDPANPEHFPELHHLRDSGNIEQDADNVWFVYRPGYYRSLEIPKEEEGIAYIIISKFRQGAARKKIPFLWQGEYTRFDNVSLQTYDKLRQKGRLEY